MSPSFRPLRSVAPTCILLPVGRFDQTIRVRSLRSMLVFARCRSSSVERNASTALTARAVASGAGGWTNRAVPIAPQATIDRIKAFHILVTMSYSCPLVRWSAGPLVRWAAGPLGRWAAGPRSGLAHPGLANQRTSELANQRTSELANQRTSELDGRAPLSG